MASSFLLRRLTSSSNTIIRRMSTTSTCTVKFPSPSPSPWLMLPPLFEGGDMLYNFYSLAEAKSLTFNKRRRLPGGGAVVDPDQIPPDDAKLVGSSHGWIATFDEKSKHVFLSNPISGRHIKLPPIDVARSISRVILSCSPEKEGCHAMTTFGPSGSAAFCTPGASTRWDHYDADFSARAWADAVYCARRGVFCTIQPLSFGDFGFYVRDPHRRYEKHCYMSYWKVPEGYAGDAGGVCRCDDIEYYLSYYARRAERYAGDDTGVRSRSTCGCYQMPHLVSVDKISDVPLIVLRFVDVPGYNDEPDEFYKCGAPNWISTMPYTTQSFLLLRCEYDGSCAWEVVDDLEDLAIFVGMNHSFAIPATGELRPNSIYFTDADAGRITPWYPDARILYGGHDIGIFDYEKRTISPCYYPCDKKSFKKTDPPPMWFTPTFN